MIASASGVPLAACPTQSFTIHLNHFLPLSRHWRGGRGVRYALTHHSSLRLLLLLVSGPPRILAEVRLALLKERVFALAAFLGHVIQHRRVSCQHLHTRLPVQ